MRTAAWFIVIRRRNWWIFVAIGFVCRFLAQIKIGFSLGIFFLLLQFPDIKATWMCFVNANTHTNWQVINIHQILFVTHLFLVQSRLECFVSVRVCASMCLRTFFSITFVILFLESLSTFPCSRVYFASIYLLLISFYLRKSKYSPLFWEFQITNSLVFLIQAFRWYGTSNGDILSLIK